jgi:hypothetical protein
MVTRAPSIVSGVNCLTKFRRSQSPDALQGHDYSAGSGSAYCLLFPHIADIQIVSATLVIDAEHLRFQTW